MQKSRQDKLVKKLLSSDGKKISECTVLFRLSFYYRSLSVYVVFPIAYAKRLFSECMKFFFLAAQTYICVSIVNQHTHPRVCKIRIIYASVQKSYLSSGLYGKPRNFSCDLNLFILIIVMLGVCQLTFEGGGVIWYSHEPFLTL